MSYPLLRLVALSAHPLLRRSARCRAVLGYMAERADHDGRGVYPAVGSIARDTLIDARDVSRAINSLKKAGLVVDVAAPLGQTVNRRINVTDLAGWAPPSIENRDRIDGWGQTHGLEVDCEGPEDQGGGTGWITQGGLGGSPMGGSPGGGLGGSPGGGLGGSPTQTSPMNQSFEPVLEPEPPPKTVPQPAEVSGRFRGPGCGEGDDGCDDPLAEVVEPEAAPEPLPAKKPAHSAATLEASEALLADWLADMAELGRDVGRVARANVARRLPEVIGGATLRGWMRKGGIAEGDVSAAQVADAIWDAWQEIRQSPHHLANNLGMPWLLTRPKVTIEHATRHRLAADSDSWTPRVEARAIVAWWAAERARLRLPPDLTAQEAEANIVALIAKCEGEKQAAAPAWIRKQLEALVGDPTRALGQLTRKFTNLSAQAATTTNRPRPTTAEEVLAQRAAATPLGRPVPPRVIRDDE